MSAVAVRGGGRGRTGSHICGQGGAALELLVQDFTQILSGGGIVNKGCGCPVSHPPPPKTDKVKTNDRAVLFVKPTNTFED